MFEPYGIFPHLIPNLIGVFLIGFLSARVGLLSRDLTLLIVVGFLGGFTTFSGYMQFLTQTNMYKGLVYILIHHLLGLGFFFIGVEFSKPFLK